MLQVKIIIKYFSLLCLLDLFKKFFVRGFPGSIVVKNVCASAGDSGEVSSIPGLGRSLGEGNGNPVQYSCLGNPMDTGVWWATVHRVAKGWTQLCNWACTQAHTGVKTRLGRVVFLLLFLLFNRYKYYQISCISYVHVKCF